MPRSFHHSIHFEYRLFPKGLRTLFVADLLRNVADQMIGLFIPIFLYQYAQRSVMWSHVMPLLRLSLFQRSIIYVCLFYVLFRVITLLITLPITHVIQRCGLTKSMIIGNVAWILSYACLYGMARSEYFVLGAILFHAINQAIYWPSYNTQFALQADVKMLGRNVGSIDFLEKLIRAMLPFIGGTIIAVFGYAAGQLTAVVILFAAIIFLLLTREVRCSYHVSLGEFFVWMRKREFLHSSIGFVGKYIGDATFLLWTIYALIFFGSVANVGYVFSIVLFISLVISYFMGWYLGKHKGKTLYSLSAGILSMLWIFRMFIHTAWHFITIDVADRMAMSVYQPIYDMLSLTWSRRKAMFHLQVYRGLIDSMAGIMFWLLVIVLFLVPSQWTGVFALASIGVLLSIFMSREERHG